MANQPAVEKLGFSPVHAALKNNFISIGEIDVVIVGNKIKVPKKREHWPFSNVFISDSIESSKIWNCESNSARPYVLCGLKLDLETAIYMIKSQHKFSPMYVVSNEAFPCSFENFCVPSLGDGKWEEAIATICSLHVSTIPQMIVEQANKTPLEIAVVSSIIPESLTYSQLVVQAWELGAAIQRKLSEHHKEIPLPENVLIGFILPPSSLSTITLLALGLRRMGAVVIAAKPPQVSEYQLQKVGCHALLAMDDTAIETIRTDVSCVINIHKMYAEIMERENLSGCTLLDVTAPRGMSVLNDVSVVEWTSGSTGKPKAMAVTAWRLAHWIRWRQYHFPMTSYGKRVGVGLFWAWYWHIPLCQGGTMVVIPDEMTVDVVSMVDYFHVHKVDWVDCLTPGQLKMMTELVSPQIYPQLPVRHIMSSGEALSVSVAHAFLTRFTSTTLSNVLSTTETAADICCLKKVTVELCEYLEKEKSLIHVPVLSEGELVVWGNTLGGWSGGEEAERLLIKGWNIEPEGYTTGEHVSSFVQRNILGEGGFMDGGNSEVGCYLTGDRIVWHEIAGSRYGCVEGRVDDVIKLRGFRVDLSGVEACLNSCPLVQDSAALSHQDTLYALVVTDVASSLGEVTKFLKENLPHSSVPTLVAVSKIEYTKTGKKDRKNMIKYLPHMGEALDLSGLDLWSEKAIQLAMEQQLGVSMKPSDNFFDLGGNSFKALRVCQTCEIPVALFFANASPCELHQALVQSSTASPSLLTRVAEVRGVVQVSGLGVRLPGANTVNELWAKLKKGEVMTESLTKDSSMVSEKGVTRCDSHCGAAFGAFGECLVPPLVVNGMSVVTPTCLEQRVLLELTYEALEDAGFDPLNMAQSGVRTGVFLCGGSLPHLGELDDMRRADPAKYFALEIGNDKDYLAASVAWAFDLRGPAEVVATACSSSLVAISRAVHAIRLGLCDVALAGGASFTPNEAVAYQEGMIWSKDGCRPFHDDAQGTLPADGAAVVCLVSESFLKSNKNRIINRYCEVEGVAVNNDGRRKGGFCQPSMAGQVEVIQHALADAEVSPNEVDFVEAHGTGTRIGDPIEVEALSQVYRHGSREHRLLVGSLKGNIGHLNTVAGVAGFVKTALCLKYGTVVPQASKTHDEPVLNTLVDWSSLPLTVALPSNIAHHIETKGRSERATVSAFGIGGTNACIVMSNKRSVDSTTNAGVFSRRPVLQLVDSSSREACMSTLKRCLFHSSSYEDDLSLEANLLERAKIRRKRTFRSYQIINRDNVSSSGTMVSSSVVKVDQPRPVVLVFPGQGGTYSEMGDALALGGLLGDNCSRFNHSNWMSSEAILRVSMAIADTITSSLPTNAVVACVGHSFGEWIAATYCGVIDREKSLEFARIRDGLVSQLKFAKSSTSSLMISIRASPSTITSLGLPTGMSVCIVNGPLSIVVGGLYDESRSSSARHDVDIKSDEIADFLLKMDENSITWKLLNTTNAFHTSAIDPLMQPLGQAVQSLGMLKLPSIPIISSVTGSYVKSQHVDDECDFTDPRYWASQCRSPVRFDKALDTLAADYPNACIIEVGPSALVGIIKQKARGLQWNVWPTLKIKSGANGPKSSIDEEEVGIAECTTFLTCLGNMYLHCGAVPSIITRPGSSLSLPPYDFSVHVPLHIKPDVPNSVSKIENKKKEFKSEASSSNVYDVQWQEVEGGISTMHASVLPVLILEHLVASTEDKHLKATAYLQELQLDACAENYFIVSMSNVAQVARKHGRLAIVAGLEDEAGEADGRDVIALSKTLVNVIQQLSHGASNTVLDLFFLLDSSPRYAPLRGLIRSCRSECSHFSVRSVTLQSKRGTWYSGEGEEGWVESRNKITRAVLPSLPMEVFVGDKFLQPRITKSVRLSKPSSSFLPQVGVLAVVTGGLAGVGLSVAKHLLVSGTASQVLLVGRTQRSSELLNEVITLGGIVVLCDVSESVQELQKVVRGLAREVELVVHCAGVIADELLINATSEHCEKVLAPKVLGTLLLHSSFPKARLVLFSSTSSSLGVVGQATYGAANAFLDEISAQWCHGNSMCTCIQWGGWGEVGMSVDHNIAPLPGEFYFTTKQGLSVMEKIISTTTPLCMALSVEWSTYTTNAAVAPASGSTLFQHVLSNHSQLPASSANSGVRSVVAPSVVCYERVFGGEASFLGERPDMAHVVNGEAILPGTSYVAWTLECVRVEYSLRKSQAQKRRANDSMLQKYRLRSCRFLKPLSLSEVRECRLVMTGIDEIGGYVSISCGEELHATLKFDWPVPQTSLLASNVVDNDDTWYGEWRNMREPYAVFAAQGFEYGPSFSRLEHVRVRKVRGDGADSNNQSVARAELSTSSFHVPSSGFLDSSLQLVSLCEGGVMGVPTKIETMEWYAPLESSHDVSLNMSAKALVKVKPTVGKSNMFDLLISDGTGSPSIKMSCIELFPLHQSHSALGFYKSALLEKDTEQSFAPHSQVVLDGSYCISLHKTEDGFVDAVVDIQDCTTKQLINLVESFRNSAKFQPLRKVIISPHASLKMQDGLISCLVGASVLCHSATSLGLEVKVNGWLNNTSKGEEVEIPPSSISVCSSDDRFKAYCDPEEAEGAVWFERFNAKKELGSSEVEIKTSCWALNFRDVLVARGAIPMDTNGEELGIGGECGGVVVRVGSQVKRLKVGDEVVAVPPDGMGSYVVVAEEFVSPPLPWGRSMRDGHNLSRVATNIASSNSAKALSDHYDISECERVVSQSLVYATAWLALEWQARIAQHDVVLVHSAAGGVGLAAIFLLQRKNCVVYATASTEEKRAILRSIGCQGVFDSRDVDGFTSGIQAAESARTGNLRRLECIDVVLNSLTGEAVDASLSLLKPFGRFVELGKRSSFEEGSLSMKPFLKGLSFSAAHVDVLMLERRPLAGQLLSQVWTALPDLPLLPQAWFAMADINEALDYMAKGVHLGKIAISTGPGILTKEGYQIKAGTKCLECVGPSNDPVLQSIKQHPLFIHCSETDSGYVAVVPGILNNQSLDYLTVSGKVPEVVFAEHGCVAVLAKSLGVKVVIELSPWLPIQSSSGQQIQRLLNISKEENSHLIATIPSVFGQSNTLLHREELLAWLTKTVSSISGVSEITVDEPFDSFGVDSLAQITLARKISAHTGLAAFSIGDLMRHPTVSSTLEHLQYLTHQSSAGSQLSKQANRSDVESSSVVSSPRFRILCLHGFRSSGELLEVSLNAMFRHETGSDKNWRDKIELVFVTAPHESSGPTDTDIPSGIPTFEWWCGDEKSYEKGWTLLGDTGERGKLQTSRRHILKVAKSSSTPIIGLIGFSQGAAMACYMAAKGDLDQLKWLACFSAVPPVDIDESYLSKNSSSDSFKYASFHAFDKSEEHASLCTDVVNLFASAPSPATAVVVHHEQGHAIPKQKNVADKFSEFILKNT